MQYQSGRFYSRQVRVSGLGFPAAPTINMEAEHRRPPGAGDQDDRLRAQKEFQLATTAMKLDVFLDVLNLNNSDSERGRRLRRSAPPSSFGVADALRPAPSRDVRRQDPLVEGSGRACGPVPIDPWRDAHEDDSNRDRGPDDPDR